MATMVSEAVREWRTTPHGEWVCDGVGIVVRVRVRADAAEWYGYPFGAKLRLGPFRSRGEAQAAMESAGPPRVPSHERRGAGSPG